MKLFAIALLALLGSACSTVPKAPSTQQLLDNDYSLVSTYLEKYIPVQMKKHRFTGLSVAIVDDQTIVWSKGFGFADKSAEKQATEHTAYRAGSVSKLFTALAVMQLVENGQLDLDAPIRDAVPEFNLKSRFGSVDNITLRNILSHYSGIPSTIQDGMFTDTPDSYKTVSQRLHRYYAAFPPNTVFAYSNAGYSVAGHAVENSSGIPFSEYVEQSLLQPLEMPHSNFEFNTSDAQLSKSYWDGEQIEELGLRDIPAGGLVTTVGDLSNLVKMVNANGYFNKQILSAEALQQMLAAQQYDSVYEPEVINGIGWFNFKGFLSKKYTTVGHTGQTMGHSAAVFIVPDIKLGVVLLANSPSLQGGLEEITEKILQLAHPVSTRTDLASVNAPDVALKALPGTESRFDGQYSSTFGHINIEGTADSYKVSAVGEKFSLKKNKAGDYKLKAKLLGFIPIKPPGIGDLVFSARSVSDEKLIYARGPRGNLTRLAAEIKPDNPVPAWDARLAEYTISNPMDSDNKFFKVDGVTLTYVNDCYNLIVKTPMDTQMIPLTIINESEAILQGYGRNLGETLFAQADGSLMYSGWIFNKK